MSQIDDLFNERLVCKLIEEVVAQLSIKVSAKDRPYSLLYTLFQSEHNYGLKSGAPNVNFLKISIRKTIWDLEFSEQLL